MSNKIGKYLSDLLSSLIRLSQTFVFRITKIQILRQIGLSLTMKMVLHFESIILVKIEQTRNSMSSFDYRHDVYLHSKK